MSKFANVSDEELRQELECRAEAKRDAEFMERRERLRTLVTNRDALLALVPHGRSSCSDDDPNNGFYSRSGGGPRCDRCALMELTEDHADNFDFTLDLRFTRVLSQQVL